MTVAPRASLPRPRAAGILPACALTLLAAFAAPAVADDPAVGTLLEQVDPVRLAQHVQRLQDFRTRHTTTDSVTAAADWLVARHAGFGYAEIQEHGFSVLGRPQRNIVVTKPGVTNPDDIYIIGGHYDSTAPDINSAPGANDDGSGTAAVLMMAEILRDVPLDATVMFAHWAAEEQGKIGSLAWVNYAFNEGLLGRVRLYMNLDACGYQGDPDDVLKFMTDPTTTLYNDQLELLCTKYTSLVPAPLGYISFSDHASFRTRGIPFTYTIEDDITPFIHTPNDLIGTMDFAYFRKVVQTNLAGLVTFAGMTATDVAEQGAAALSGGPALRLAGRNPSDGAVELEADLPAEGEATIAVYDTAGRLVTTLSLRAAGSGPVRCSWDGRRADGARVPAGVYQARLRAPAGRRPDADPGVKLVLLP